MKDERTVVITGGTGLLGSVVVPRLESEYRCVLIRRETADLSRAEEVDRAFARIGEIYGVVHLVGGFAAGDAPETWSNMIALNVTAAANVMRAAVPHLGNGGRVVAISSTATIDRPKGLSAYVATKSALNALVEVLAVELKDRRITANAILPSTLGENGVPTQRVADTIAWLLSGAAANVTGSLIPLRA